MRGVKGAAATSHAVTHAYTTPTDIRDVRKRLSVSAVPPYSELTEVVQEPVNPPKL